MSDNRGGQRNRKKPDVDSEHLRDALESATPATQIDPEVSKAPHLSRKTLRRQFDPGCPPASADLIDAAAFCVTGVALSAPQSRSCEEAWHFREVAHDFRKRTSATSGP